MFLYKTSVALFLGLMLGVYFALVHGYIPLWFIPIHVLGSIGIGYVLLTIFIKYVQNEHALLKMIFRRGNAIITALSSLLCITVFIGGFTVPYAVTGNLDGLESKIRHIPETASGKNIGNFEEEEFEKAYNRAAAFIGSRRVEWILFYQNFTRISAEMPDKKYALRGTSITGNRISTYGSSYSPSSSNSLFTVNEASLAIVKKAIADVAKDHDLKSVLYIGLQKGVRWRWKDENGHRDHARYLDITFVLKGAKSLKYDGRKGVRIE